MLSRNIDTGERGDTIVSDYNDTEPPPLSPKEGEGDPNVRTRPATATPSDSNNYEMRRDTGCIVPTHYHPEGHTKRGSEINTIEIINLGGPQRR